MHKPASNKLNNTQTEDITAENRKKITIPTSLNASKETSGKPWFV